MVRVIYPSFENLLVLTRPAGNLLSSLDKSSRQLRLEKTLTSRACRSFSRVSSRSMSDRARSRPTASIAYVALFLVLNIY